jgi:hypothetical protein
VGLRNLLFSRVDQKAGINQLAIQFARCAYPARKSLFLFLYTANDELSRARLNYSSGIAPFIWCCSGSRAHRNFCCAGAVLRRFGVRHVSMKFAVQLRPIAPRRVRFHFYVTTHAKDKRILRLWPVKIRVCDI